MQVINAQHRRSVVNFFNLIDQDSRYGYKFLLSAIWNVEFFNKFLDEHKKMYGYTPRLPRTAPTVVETLQFNKKFVESIGGEQIGPSGGTNSDFLFYFEHGFWPWSDVRDLISQRYRK